MTNLKTHLEKMGRVTRSDKVINLLHHIYYNEIAYMSMSVPADLITFPAARFNSTSGDDDNMKLELL